MKRSETLSRAIDVLADACQKIVNEKKAPLHKQISRLQALDFAPTGEAGRLSFEAATSENPRELLIRAAESLQREDVLNTAASLRGSVVQAVGNKLSALEGSLKPLARLRTLAAAATEQATKAVIGRNVGGGQDFVSSSVERHLQANVNAALVVVEDIRGAFHDPRLDKPLQSVAEAFSGILDMVLEAEGV